jgi:AraC-like DNA-binding protein
VKDEILGQETVKGVEKDMFGQPVMPIRDRRGRPSFKISVANQRVVVTRVAAGWKQAAIAAELGCDEKTLRKNFSRELENGLAMLEGMMLDLLFANAATGSNAAIKQMMVVIDVTRLRNEPKAISKGKPLGKKTIRDEEAKKAPSSWEDAFKLQ